jgi:hypothetical protein
MRYCKQCQAVRETFRQHRAGKILSVCAICTAVLWSLPDHPHQEEPEPAAPTPITTIVTVQSSTSIAVGSSINFKTSGWPTDST